MCYFNRLPRVARLLADYPEWLQLCWDFVKHPGNDEIAFQHFFLLAAVQEAFFYFICAACNFFLPTSACRKFCFKIAQLLSSCTFNQIITVNNSRMLLSQNKITLARFVTIFPVWTTWNGTDPLLAREFTQNDNNICMWSPRPSQLSPPQKYIIS